MQYLYRLVLTAFIICTCAINQNIGQLDTINLIRYKNPEFKFTTFDIRGNLRQNHNDDESAESETNLQIGPIISLTQRINRANHQRTARISSGAFTRLGDEITVPNRIQNSLGLDLSVNDIYHKKYYYIEFNPYVDVNYFTTRDNRQVFRSNNSIFLGIGQGRVEDVSDMALAYFIFKSLESNRVLNRTIHQSEYESLAQVIGSTEIREYSTLEE